MRLPPRLNCTPLPPSSSGVSRSCTTIIAYMMWKYLLTYDAAYLKVRALRPLCSPNSGFIACLLRWAVQLSTADQVCRCGLWPVLCAERPHPAKYWAVHLGISERRLLRI